MPYTDHADKIARQRERRRAQRDERARQKAQHRGETRQSDGVHTPNLARSTHSSPATTPLEAITPSEVRTPVYFGKDVVGYVGPDGAIVKERPQPPVRHSRPLLTPRHVAPRAPTERTGRRRQLLDTYTRLRDAGHTDTSAQAQLTAQQRQAHLGAHEHEIQAHIRDHLPQARHWLRVNAGAWSATDAWAVARRMVEQDRTLWPAPHQADPAPKLLPDRAGSHDGRAPGQPRGQLAQPIATGQVKHRVDHHLDRHLEDRHLGQLPPLSPTEITMLVAEAARQVQLTPARR